MPSAKRDQRVSVPRLMPPALFGALLEMLRRAYKPPPRTHEWQWYELFVKAGLFLDPRYDTRVCASNAREAHNALYRHRYRLHVCNVCRLRRILPQKYVKVRSDCRINNKREKNVDYRNVRGDWILA